MFYATICATPLGQLQKARISWVSSPWVMTSSAASSGAKASSKPSGTCESFRRCTRRGCRSATTATAKQIRGLQSTVGVAWSRVAERRLNATVLFDGSAVAPRRRMVCLVAVRGLKPTKPTTTIVVSLRETRRKYANTPASLREASTLSLRCRGLTTSPTEVLGLWSLVISLSFEL